MAKLSTAAIMAVVTGKRIGPMDRILELLDYMKGDLTFADDVVLRGACANHLIAQMPWLADIDPNLIDGNNVQVWVKSMIRRHGEFHEVTPLQN